MQQQLTKYQCDICGKTSYSDEHFNHIELPYFERFHEASSQYCRVRLRNNKKFDICDYCLAKSLHFVEHVADMGHGVLDKRLVIDEIDVNDFYKK